MASIGIFWESNILVWKNVFSDPFKQPWTAANIWTFAKFTLQKQIVKVRLCLH